MDVTGRIAALENIVISTNEPIQTIVFSTEGLPNGTYILNGISESGISYFEKVIINK